MKTFSMIILMALGSVVAINAQKKSYTPNARQAVQKPRMQPPQYMQVTQPQNKEASKEQATPRKETVKGAPAQVVNYQKQRSLTMEAPKRRGKKSAQSYTRLASNKK